MAQFLRPTSDISNDGWTYSTGSTAYVLLDEATASDSDYVVAVTSTSSLVMGLSGTSQPYASGDGTLRVRAKRTTTSPTLILQLFDSSYDYVGDSLSITAGSSFATSTFTISATDLPNVAMIELYGKNVQVSWVELETPDVAPITSGLEMGMMF